MFDTRLLKIAEELLQYTTAAKQAPSHVIFSVDPIQINHDRSRGEARRIRIVLPDSTGNTVTA